MVRIVLIAQLLLCASCFARTNLIDDIRIHYRPDEYQTVLAGETSVPVFRSMPTTALAHGIAFIIFDDGFQGLNLETAKELARHLNELGWHTVISPPLLEYITPEENEEGDAELAAVDENVDALHARNDDASLWVDHSASEVTMNVLVNALYQDAETIQGFRLMISQGMSAAQILSLSSKETIPVPDSLVVINPYWPQRDINNAISEQLANTHYPVLDLQLRPASVWIRSEAEKHRETVTRALKLHYRQKVLNVNSWPVGAQSYESPFSSNLAKEIYSWSTHLGW